MARKTICYVMAALAIALTAGCYEPVGVNITQPGEYKGDTDPLLAKLQSDELQNELEARFQGQTDR